MGVIIYNSIMALIEHELSKLLFPAQLFILSHVISQGSMH